MDEHKNDRFPHLQRERFLYRYHRALKRDDLDTATKLMRQASSDPELERMVRDYTEALRAARTRPSSRADARSVNAARLPRSGDLELKNKIRPPQWWGGVDSMIGSTLKWPDRPIWHEERGYSAQAAQALTRAYRLLNQCGPDVGKNVFAGDVGDAFEQLDVALDSTLSRSQYIRGNYIRAVALDLAKDYTGALACIDRARNAVSEAGTEGDQVDLLYMRALVDRKLGFVRDSARDFHVCLEAYREQVNVAGAGNPGFEAAAVVNLAFAAFILAQYQAVDEYLDSARGLIRGAPDCKVEAGALMWLQSLIFRWRLQPHDALSTIAQAVELYESSGFGADAARLYLVAGDAAADIAEEMPQGATRDSFVSMAWQQHQRGYAYLPQREDKAGRVLADLTYMRIGRLRGQAIDRVAQLDHILNHPDSALRDDLAIRVQTLTALGDEFVARGEREQAMRCYQQAVAGAGSEMPALAAFARRGLLRGQEHM